jgi:coenzyme F420 hydrogenase subunit beta
MRAMGLAVPQERGLALFPLWWRLPVRAKVQSLAGTAKRILRARLWRPVVVKP